MHADHDGPLFCVVTTQSSNNLYGPPHTSLYTSIWLQPSYPIAISSKRLWSLPWQHSQNQWLKTCFCLYCTIFNVKWWFKYFATQRLFEVKTYQVWQTVLIQLMLRLTVIKTTQWISLLLVQEIFFCCITQQRWIRKEMVSCRCQSFSHSKLEFFPKCSRNLHGRMFFFSFSCIFMVKSNSTSWLSPFMVPLNKFNFTLPF